MAQSPLITPLDLLAFGAGSDFLSQFRLRPLVVQILVGGALGVMTFQWKVQGDSAFSPELASEAGSSWYTLLDDPAFGALTFGAGTYVADTTYVVGTTGITGPGSMTVPVTPGAGALAALTAARFDPILTACDAVTSKGVTWLQPRVVPPVVSVGAQIKEWLASLAIYSLKSRQGITPPSAPGQDGQTGDDNVRRRADVAEKNLKAIGASEDRPPDLVDSSTGSGAGLPAYPESDDLRGW